MSPEESLSQEENIKTIATRLRSADRILFITGAGISVESGVPTYRGIGGLYNGFTEDGMPIERALSIGTLATNPELCWKYIHQVESACRDAHFNRAHKVIADMGGVVLTQNVDGFHEAAGSQDIIDIHGDIHNLLCTACTWSNRVEDYVDLDTLPSCPDCGELVRPDVVLFDESLPTAKLDRLYEEIYTTFDVILSIGTTSLFPYITMPVILGKRMGSYTVEINPDNTDISNKVDVHLKMTAGDALTKIWDYMQKGKEKHE